MLLPKRRPAGAPKPASAPTFAALRPASPAEPTWSPETVRLLEAPRSPPDTVDTRFSPASPTGSRDSSKSCERKSEASELERDPGHDWGKAGSRRRRALADVPPLPEETTEPRSSQPNKAKPVPKRFTRFLGESLENRKGLIQLDDFWAKG